MHCRSNCFSSTKIFFFSLLQITQAAKDFMNEWKVTKTTLHGVYSASDVVKMCGHLADKDVPRTDFLPCDKFWLSIAIHCQYLPLKILDTHCITRSV